MHVLKSATRRVLKGGVMTEINEQDNAVSEQLILTTNKYKYIRETNRQVMLTRFSRSLINLDLTPFDCKVLTYSAWLFMNSSHVVSVICGYLELS